MTRFFVFSFLCFAAVSVRGQDPTLRFGGQIPPEVDLIYERGLEWLAQKQSADGTWKDGQQGSGVDGVEGAVLGGDVVFDPVKHPLLFAKDGRIGNGCRIRY